jgi:putative membrane protein
MSTKWQTPIIFDLDDLNAHPQESNRRTNYAPPVVISDVETTVSNAEMASNAKSFSTDNILETLETEKLDLKLEGFPSLMQLVEKSGKVWEKLSIPTTSPWFWLLCGLGLWWIGMLLVDSFNFIAARFSNNLLIGLFFLGLFGIIVVSLARLSWAAWQDFLALKSVSNLQTEGQELLESKNYGHAMPYINKISRFYAQRQDVKERLDRFYMTVNDSHLNSEVCALFSKQVLKEIDEKAYCLILKQARETALLVALSPRAFLSTILTLWSTVKMIRDLATLYGGRPGFISSISLIVKVFQSLIYAGISERIAESVSDLLGGSLLSVVSAQLAQGVGSGILTARVGLHTMQKCRPLPFRADEQPQWQSIAREIWASFKSSDVSVRNAKTA